MIKYTPEQHEILDFFESMPDIPLPNDKEIVLVSAGAGTGKSFMSKQVVDLLKPKKGLYTAFNKAIVKEGVSRFKGTNIECKTLHALAYKYVNPGTIEDLTYSCITENISYSEKAEIINAIDMFYVSGSTDMYTFMEYRFAGEKSEQRLIDLSIKYIEMMINKEISPTFNFLLKYFHLMLVEKTVECKYDLVVLDEINDTTAVALEIFKLIEAPKKLGLGETNQAIYQFLNLVNGFDELDGEATVLRLTQSFRCSEKIAADIQRFMKKEVSDDFKFIGTDEPVENGKFLYCTMTNALIINEICERLSAGKGFYLLRNISEIFACPLALMSVNSGKEPYQKKYKFLTKEYKYYQDKPRKGQSFFQYLLDHVDDTEIQNAVRLLMSFSRRNINLFDIYKRAKAAPVDHTYTIATVFTSKGLEYETVTIADDLNTKITSIRDNGGIQTEEDLVAYRCYYVACSRAGKNLHNAKMLQK